MTKRNFDFLKHLPDFADLYIYCNSAEQNQKGDPGKSALSACRAMEYIVKTIYLVQEWNMPARSSLFELVDAENFRSFINDNKLMMALHYIRRAGNNAAHLGNVSAKESFFSVLNLHTFVCAVLEKFGAVSDVPLFDESLLTDGRINTSILAIALTTEEPAKELITKFRSYIKQNDSLKAKNPQYFTEAETRQFYIDQQLREAGWDVLSKKGAILSNKACIEIKVESMANTSGVGYVDYVLFGRNGIPFALVEAKKTGKNAQVGKHQASLYADCLQKKYGVRPIIYYTNGYETNIIDDLGYPSRTIYGFHTHDELELLIQRKGRKNVTDLTIKDTITNREYQKRAITLVCEYFNKKHRRALLVMATGTGKTRVAISLVELLKRNNWIKNVLFLADRTALVRQAHKNFIKLLPQEITCVLSDSSMKDRDMDARIMFSTYHTMINYIDSDSKEFSIGRFDLIIVDEAHRSIFGRFGAIFDYFDSLLIGLTATPREEIDRSTYQIFGMEQGVPNFSYELDEAVKDGFLVPYRGLKRHSEHLRGGIKYNELSQDEKDQLEKVWDYETTINEIEKEDYKRDIINTEMFKYIYNDNTIDKVLQDLMTNGLRVQSGERIGKTIIFANNHKHAEQIVKRFTELYPEHGPDFCVLIDYSVNYAQNLIERFDIRDKDPQIAVSVDMLDTGIDIPDALNLVFFKEVKSKIKFMQMIGRGTRLSEDIFGVGKDKKKFYIFDYCQNFDYFDLKPEGADAKVTQSLTERIFCLKSEIAFELQSYNYQEDNFSHQLHDSLKNGLKSQIISLNPLRIDVRKNLLYVDKYKQVDSWVYISHLDLMELKSYIAPILSSTKEDESAKKFDLLILNIQLSLLNKLKKATSCKQGVITMAQALYEKGTIKEVKDKIETIKEILTDSFWKTLSLERLEHARLDLRDLMKHLTGNNNDQTFNVDIEDVIKAMGETDDFLTVRTYEQRVIDYLVDHSNSQVIQKIRNIEPITHADILELEKILWEDLGTKEEYEEYTPKMLVNSNVAVFIRSIVGIDRRIAVERFGQFLSDNILNSEQQEYLKMILDYVCKNGDITTDVIINESPFDNFDWQSIFGDNVALIGQYVNVIHNVIRV